MQPEQEDPGVLVAQVALVEEEDVVMGIVGDIETEQGSREVADLANSS